MLYTAEDVLDDLAGSRPTRRRAGRAGAARWSRPARPGTPSSAWSAGDPHPAARLRVRGPPRVGQGRRRGARHHRVGGVDEPQAAAHRARRPPLHPYAVGPGVHSGRAAPGQPGHGDPRPPEPDRARGQRGRSRAADAAARLVGPVRRARGTRADQPVHQPGARPRRRAQRPPGHGLRRPAGLPRRRRRARAGRAPHPPRSGAADVPGLRGRGGRRSRAPGRSRHGGSRPARRPGLAPRARCHRGGRRDLDPAGSAEGAREAAAHLPERRRRAGRDPARHGARHRGRVHRPRRPPRRPAGPHRRTPPDQPRLVGDLDPVGDQQISAAAELVRFVGTPRATQAMLRGEAAGVGRFRPAVHVTLWS